MINSSWVKEFPGSITVCALDGNILDMNDKAVEVFKDDGGAALIGKNLLDCHPEPARKKVMQMLVSQQKNVYSIEKNGIRKLIYQTPWYENGECRGFLELSIEIPTEMPHFVRD